VFQSAQEIRRSGDRMLIGPLTSEADGRSCVLHQHARAVEHHKVV
jgi:hypothetical protein